MKLSLITLFVMLILAFSNNGFLYNPVGLYAQESGGGYGLELTVFTVDKTAVSQNESFTVTARTRNKEQERWSGRQTGIDFTVR